MAKLAYIISGREYGSQHVASRRESVPEPTISPASSIAGCTCFDRVA